MKTTKLFLSAILVAVVAAVGFGSAGASAATLVHAYELDNSFADALGGPAIVPTGGALAATRYTFPANGGLRLTGGLVDTSDYSIVMVFEYDSLSPFFKKVVDFEQLSLDVGVYVEGDRLEFFSLAAGGPDMFAANTDFQIVLTRDSATQTARGYLNGVLQWSGTDNTGQAISTNNVLNFFQDDTRSAFFEAQSGSVDCIAIHDGALSADEVEVIASEPGCGTAVAAPAVPALDHFLCYDAKNDDEDSDSKAGPVVELIDQFGPGLFRVQRTDRLCVPANKNDEGIADEVTHLQGYKIKDDADSDSDSDSDSGSDALSLRLDNQFGETFVSLKKPKRLLVPTAKDLVTPPALLDLPITVDHFKCYDVKGDKIDGLMVSASDQLNPERFFDVKKPTRLCAPVDKNGEGILHPDDHLLCYQIKLVPGFCDADDSPTNGGGVCRKEKDCGGVDGKKGKPGTSFCEKQLKDQKLDAFLNNQFASSLVKVKKVKELCVPSQKTIL